MLGLLRADVGASEQSGKMFVLERMISALAAAGRQERVVVVSNSTRTLDIAQDWEMDGDGGQLRSEGDGGKRGEMRDMGGRRREKEGDGGCGGRQKETEGDRGLLSRLRYQRVRCVVQFVRCFVFCLFHRRFIVNLFSCR